MLKNAGLDTNFCGVLLRAKKRGDTAILRTNKTRSTCSRTSCGVRACVHVQARRTKCKAHGTGDVTHKVCVQHLQPLVARPVWYNGFGVSLVCTHLRWVSVVDGLYRRWFGCFVVTGTCCVLHVVSFSDDYCSYDVLSGAAPRLIYVEAMPEVHRASARSSDWIVRPRIRVKLVEQDINCQRSEKCAVGKTSVSDRRC